MDPISKALFSLEAFFKAPLIAILAFLVSLFPNWGGLQYQYQSTAFNMDAITTSVVSAVEKRDIAALEAMMCRNIKDNTPDLSGRIVALIDSIDGKIKKYDFSPAGSFDESKSGKRVTQRGWDISLQTSSGAQYTIWVIWEVANNFAPEETKIRKIVLFEAGPNAADERLAGIDATKGVMDWHDES